MYTLYHVQSAYICNSTISGTDHKLSNNDNTVLAIIIIEGDYCNLIGREVSGVFEQVELLKKYMEFRDL